MKDVWIWDPVASGAAFEHPARLPCSEQEAQAFFVAKAFGPMRCKLSKAKVVDRKGGVTMVRREDGSNQEVPVSRVLPWYEGRSSSLWPFGAGLLVLQEVEVWSEMT